LIVGELNVSRAVRRTRQWIVFLLMTIGTGQVTPAQTTAPGSARPDPTVKPAAAETIPELSIEIELSGRKLSGDQAVILPDEFKVVFINRPAGPSNFGIRIESRAGSDCRSS
jgi:hypothetical protein